MSKRTCSPLNLLLRLHQYQTAVGKPDTSVSKMNIYNSLQPDECLNRMNETASILNKKRDKFVFFGGNLMPHE